MPSWLLPISSTFAGNTSSGSSSPSPSPSPSSPSPSPSSPSPSPSSPSPSSPSPSSPSPSSPASSDGVGQAQQMMIENEKTTERMRPLSPRSWAPANGAP